MSQQTAAAIGALLSRHAGEVTASGPMVIAMSALHAERVMFALGADVERLAWGIELAKMTRKDAGLDPDAIALGAYGWQLHRVDDSTNLRELANSGGFSAAISR